MELTWVPSGMRVRLLASQESSEDTDNALLLVGSAVRAAFRFIVSLMRLGILLLLRFMFYRGMVPMCFDFGSTISTCF
jgi:hypothetical protein